MKVESESVTLAQQQKRFARLIHIFLKALEYLFFIFRIHFSRKYL